MSKYSLIIGVFLINLGSGSLISFKKDKTATLLSKIQNVENVDIEKDTLISKKDINLTDFVPKGYVIYEKNYGDLNKDGINDCVITVKGTDKKSIIKDRYGIELDRNRRGILVLIYKNGSYILAVKNVNCFSSENEDGGVYFAPELSIEINNGNVYINYSHGRYGNWVYTFRFQNSDAELIGYDSSSNRGPVTNTQTSINYLSNKKIINENTNIHAEGGDEVFKQTVTRIKKSKPIKLSEIKNFDGLKIPEE